MEGQQHGVPMLPPQLGMPDPRERLAETIRALQRGEVTGGSKLPPTIDQVRMTA